MIARTIVNWEHDFRTGMARVYVTVKDDTEGTEQTRMFEYPDTVLPAALKAWEQSVATNKGATLAVPPPVQP